MRRDLNTASSARRLRREDGVSLIMVALSIFVLTSFLVVVLDYGVLWTARRQAQNSADAGALAGAVARSFDETTDPPSADGIAYESAVAAAHANDVFGEDGGVVVSWDCPAYAEGARCVRVDVHRDGADIDGVAGADSNPLPVFFAQLFGINGQNVRATATAWVATGNTTNCMRPFAVADHWNDVVDPTLTPPEFQRWDTGGGPGSGSELSPKDVYVPPSSSSDGTGFTVEEHLGAQVFLKTGNNPNSAANGMTPGWSLPVRLPDGEGDYVSGGAEFSSAIKYCIGNPVSIGDYLPLESGVMVGPTQQGVDVDPGPGDPDSLTEQDENAKWDTGTKTVVDTCAPACAPFSPRIVPVAVFDQDEFQWRTSNNNWTTSWTPGVGPGTGSFDCPIGGRCVRVVNIIGFFVEGMVGQDVMGRVVMYPGDFTTGGGEVSGSASFLRTIQLIR
jgi:Flp pilus assembly protein TadG